MPLACLGLKLLTIAVFRQMVIVASLSKPFTYTGKGTPRRNAVLNAYEPEIEQAYAAVEESSQTTLTLPESCCCGNCHFEPIGR